MPSLSHLTVFTGKECNLPVLKITGLVCTQLSGIFSVELMLIADKTSVSKAKKAADL